MPQLCGTGRPIPSILPHLNLGTRSKTMQSPYVRLIFAFMVMLTLCLPASSAAQVSVGIAVAFAPPDLPVYEQPICPGEGYIWTPGYWPYFGHGYEGGRWDGGRFFYNRSVNNVNVTVIHNVYNTTVVNQSNVTRISYNGGNGGINERPRPEEEAAAHARHLPPVLDQRQHVQAARSNQQLRASVNRGRPPIAATPKPGAFNEHGVVPAREAGAIHNAGPGNAGRGNAGPGNNVPRPTTAVHPNELPRRERPGPANTGNPKLDQKYQQQQEKLYTQQERDRQKLQQQQEKEHQQLARQNADEARKQQVEQRHQQQTEQLVQKHSQQQQKLQEKQPEARPAPPKEKEKH